MALQEEFEYQGNYLFRYRSILPLIILIPGLLVFAWYKYHQSEGFSFITYEAYEFICLATCLLGLAIRIYTVGHTPKNTSGRNTENQLADELNTTGIYSTVRHPLYVGNFFMWLGIAMLTANFWFVTSFVLLYWVYYERIMYAEEQFLRRKFGDIYLKWAEKTPAFVLSFKNWQKPKLPFSMKKVLKKEKNGIFAIFVLMFAFKVLGDFIEAGSFEFQISWHLYAVLLSGIFYLILKIIKHNTKILDEKGR